MVCGEIGLDELGREGVEGSEFVAEGKANVLKDEKVLGCRPLLDCETEGEVAEELE